MNFKAIIAVLVVSFCPSLSAQKLELDAVTVEQLNQKVHQTETNAPAGILFKKATTKFKYFADKGYVSFTEVDLKIKIFKKEGLEWANFKIPYFVGYDNLEDETVEIVKAFTYNFKNNQITKEKVTKTGKIEEKVNEFWKAKTVLFPNAEEGSILELKYILKSQNAAVLPDFQFQYDIPVDFAEYITEIPEFYIYKGIKNGSLQVDLKETIEETATKYIDSHNSSAGFYHKQIKSVYTIKNIPALKEEAFVTNIHNYYGKIEHELQTVRMPNEKPEQISKTWGDVALSIYGKREFGKEIEKQSYYNTDLKSWLTQLDSEKSKLEKIFTTLQARMNWNKSYGYMPKQPLNYAYESKVGNAAEINLILVSMLRTAGLNANPVLLSTKDNGIALFPNKSKINFVIASVEIGTERFLLDATDKYTTIYSLPVNNLNWNGQLIKKDGTCVEIDLMPKIISKESVSLIGTFQKDGSVSGKVRQVRADYNALVFRQNEGLKSQDAYLAELEKDWKGTEISDYKIENKQDVNKPIVEMYSFKNDGYYESIGDKIYFLPLGFMAYTENPFKEEKRVYPIDFNFPNQEKMLFTIDLPEGYVVESIPQSLSLTLSDKSLSYKFMISNTGKQLQVSSTFDINTSIVAPQDYDELKSFFSEMIKKQTEKVVLKKA
ncbi:hypothetical protein [Flavobacterium sp. GCM10027622]|uniref:hypothetical protein n=1 Tax=unclassified Flavobacterium TaxID=196869 RepID=UPI00361740B9